MTFIKKEENMQSAAWDFHVTSFHSLTEVLILYMEVPCTHVHVYISKNLIKV